MSVNTSALGVLALLLSLYLLCLTASVRGQAGASQRPGEDSSARRDDVVSAQVSPQLVAKLALLEAGRRLNRGQASDAQAWAASRAQRAAQHRQEIAQVWGSVVNSIDGQAKLRLHAERMSRLNRMLDLAEHGADKVLVTRIRTDITRELTRHAKAMQVTVAAFGAP
jgi:hypothetical protein